MSCLISALLVLLTVDSVYDIKKREIPPALTLAAAAVFITLNCCVLKTPVYKLAFGMISGLLIILTGVFGGGIGAGDGFVFLAVGAVLTFDKFITVLFLAFLSCSLFGAALMKLRKKRKEELPFVPFILAGTLITVLLF